MNRVVEFLRSHKQGVAYYVGGFFVLGLAVNMMKASNLGTGAWDTVTINSRAFFNWNIGWEWVTIGMMSLVVSGTLFCLVLLYRKNMRYLWMLIPIFMVAVFIDFWNIVVFQDRIFDDVFLQSIFFVTGTVILPLGLTMIVKSSFPAFVFDELMLMLVQLTKAKRILFVRLGIEITGIAIGALFGYLAYYGVDGTLGTVNWGSLLFALTLSPIMSVWFRVLGVPHETTS